MILMTALGLAFHCSRTEIIGKNLAAPTGMALCSNQLFVVESNRNTIAAISRDGGPSKKISGFTSPMDVACYRNILYVADFGADTIKKLSLNGKFLAKYGGPGSGRGQFDSPVSLMVHRDRIYIADFYNHRIQVFSIKGNFLASIGRKGHGPGELYYPGDAFVAGELIYVADSYNHRIQIFSKNGKLKNILTKSKYGFKVPSGIVRNKNGIFVADSGNFRVLYIPDNGKRKPETIWSRPPTKPYSPTRILWDSTSSQLYIADTAGDTVLRIRR